MKVTGWDFAGVPRWKWYLRRLRPRVVAERIRLGREVAKYKRNRKDGRQ